ncbi:flavin reductase family protein [Dactylosporangium sp. NPDC000555]|uniref:flavin reductase family protein n=1 Tax=Dactylosporangium sp. NPDC000555 TaxID=3154260 RepID=UPI0033267CC0
MQSESALDVIDTQQLRRAFGVFATGVTVVTVGGATPHGMTANSFAAVSLQPPLVLLCVQRDAIMHDALTQCPLFAVSVLAASQEPVARHFADRRRPLGSEQFQVVDWLPGAATGAPLIAGAAAHLECEVWQTYDGGDHSIFIGRLLSLRRCAEDVLVFLHGQFHTLAA